MLRSFMRTLATLAFLMPMAAAAELPRLLPLVDLRTEGANRFAVTWPKSSPEFIAMALDAGLNVPLDLGRTDEAAVIEPVIFWSEDGLLCAQDERTEIVECRDPVRGVPPVRRKRPARPALPVKSLQWGGATLSQAGVIAGGEVKRVAKLRCGRSPLLDRREYRYLPGPGGQLAVIVLEEDDLREDCARLDAQCGDRGTGACW
jgi:hypothetical protein